MEFLVTTQNATSFTNKELQKSTDFIFKLGDAIKNNWFAHVDAAECYKDDGFNTVHEWVEKTFGIKKTASYSLLTIGKEYTRKIVNASGKTVGYGSNLISACLVTVSPIQVTSLDIDKEEVILKIGETSQLLTSIIPEIATDFVTVVWSSLDNTVATVDQNGVVTGIKEGTVDIYVYHSVDPSINLSAKSISFSVFFSSSICSFNLISSS